MVMQHTKHQGSRPSGFRQEDFIMFYFPYTSICTTCDPPLPLLIQTKLEVHLVITPKHQGLRSCGFRQEDRFRFSLNKPRQQNHKRLKLKWT